MASVKHIPSIQNLYTPPGAQYTIALRTKDCYVQLAHYHANASRVWKEVYKEPGTINTNKERDV